MESTAPQFTYEISGIDRINQTMKSKQPLARKKPLDAGLEPITPDVSAHKISVDLTSPADGSSANPIGRMQKSPKLPHERDESVDMTGGVQSEQVRQAAKDIKNGLKDTSRAPEADAAYQKQK